MLIRNVAYLYGLANGSRGKVVGVVYGSNGVGSLTGDRRRLPRLLWSGFLPRRAEMGADFTHVLMKDGTRMTREQFPLSGGYALTVNKAQGLTIKEGFAIHL